jgi:endonuclease/exonuclease/phosphatase (EEP) superfamily protein YafD
MTRWIALTTASLLAGCSSPRREPRAPEPREQTLTLLTYNVNYGLEGDESTIEAIREADAEVVLLQETTPGWERALRRELAELYPHMMFRHSGGAGGLAILSRHPVEELDYIPAPSGWFPAWRLLLQGPFGPVQLLAVHLHPPVSESGSVVSGYFSAGDVRRRELETYLESLDPDLPTLIAGDLNERDGEALELLRAQGFRSALPEFQGNVPTWRWQTSVGTIRTQLDHVLYDSRLQPLDAQVLTRGRSDHLPVLVTLSPAG